MRPLPNPFEAAQRGKRNIVLNLKTRKGARSLMSWCAAPTLIMHNQRPGKAEKIALDTRRCPDQSQARLLLLGPVMARVAKVAPQGLRSADLRIHRAVVRGSRRGQCP